MNVPIIDGRAQIRHLIEQRPFCQDEVLRDGFVCRRHQKPLMQAVGFCSFESSLSALRVVISAMWSKA